ncbi:spore coat protein CotJB [Anaerovorax odorimutans]|uniref:spore coat protein CotJB n=1 Tax=Anaerovorax odorimutans TaxID=109327 RepID=UPI00040031EC|nr:spore coat protein CotJB [Anaerovorax odorimutans]
MDYSRMEMLKKIQMLSLVLLDTNLFLDTHPMDTAALNFYDKYRALLEKTRDEYTSMYGPLTPASVNTSDGWTWIDKPWPWEMEA